MIVKTTRAGAYKNLGIREFVFGHLKLLTFVTALVAVVATLVIAVEYRSPIGKELSHSYWPQTDLQTKNIPGLTPFVGRALSNALKVTFFSPDVPTVLVDIKFKHFQKLNELRKRVVSKGFALDEDRKYFPAIIRYGSTKSKIKMRLKGDILDHYNSERWSFRVKVKDGDAFLGMKNFSIQEPERRGFTAEAVFFAHLAQYDILVPRYQFVNLILNGQERGIMAVEEVPSKELLENGRRRESIIFRYNDTANWESLSEGNVVASKYYQNHFAVDFAAYHQKKINKNPKLHRLFTRGKSLLEGWREGRFKTSNVFDVKRWARLIAISEIWGSRHQLKYHNLRFYFNPVNERIEPVVYDRGRVFYNDPSGRVDELITRDVSFVEHLLKDPEMHAAFNEAMINMATDVVSNRIIDEIAPVAKTATDQLIFDKFYLMDFPFQTLIARSKKILARNSYEQRKIRRTKFQPLTGDNLKSVAYGHFLRLKSGIRVEMSNKLPLPVEICGLTLTDPANQLNKILDVSDDSSAVFLSPAPIPISYPTKRSLDFRMPAKEVYELSREAKVTACLLVKGSSGPVHDTFTEIAPPELTSISIATANLTSQEVVDQHPMLSRKSDAVVRIGTGVWYLKQDLIIPKGITLEIARGAVINVSEGAMIVVRGPTNFIGTKEEPINFISAEEDSAWNGIVVLQDETDKSTWKHVIVRNTATPKYRGWTTTGAVTFHRGNVELENVLINKTSAEDALNMVSASYTATRLIIDDTRSDAFDCDFCKGRLDGFIAKNIGGDGYDISGTETTIANSQFKNIFDKALSVGEGSSLRGMNIEVQQAGYAVVSKDGSVVDIEGIRLTEISEVGFMAYKKKTEYPGEERITASGIITTGQFELARSAANTNVLTNGQKVKTEQMNIEKLYSSGVMKKIRTR